jgi:hypothetical protein
LSLFGGNKKVTAFRAGFMMSAAIALAGIAHAGPAKPFSYVSTQALINAPASAGPAPASSALEESGAGPVPDPADAKNDDAQKIQTLHEENVRLRAALESERREFESRALHDKNSSLTAELDQKIDLLQRENADLREKISAAKPAPEVKPDIPLSDGMKSLQTENSILKQEIALLQADVTRPVGKAGKESSADRRMADADNNKLAQANQKEREPGRAASSLQQQQVIADRKLSEAMLKPAEAGQGPVRFSNSLLTVSELEELLGPDVVLNDGIKKSDSSPGSVAYVWETGRLSGSAEQQPLKNRAGFKGEISKFLAKAKSLCTGSFAAKPGIKKQANGVVASTYEIVCIGRSGALSASLLFYSRKGLFTAIAHESGLDDMDAAMDVRDKLAARLLLN